MNTTTEKDIVVGVWPGLIYRDGQAALKFLKGTIVSVDCNSAPAATLTVASAGKNWTMQVRDSHHVLVMGADGFSCSWSKQKVALN